jgi:hypothetical protein
MARIEEGDPFVIEILEDGIALYEDDGVHGRLLPPWRRLRSDSV